MRTAALMIVALALAGITVAAVRSGCAARDNPDAIMPAVGRTPDVSVGVDHILEWNKLPGHFGGRSVITFVNHADRPIKVKLPVVRELGVGSDSVSYFPPPESGSLAESRVLTIAPRSTAVVESTFGMSMEEKLTADDLYAGKAKPYRCGWVFDVPDGEKPDDWLSGTIISDPVRWRPPGGPN